MDRQLLLAKKEVTYGVDPVAVAANTVLCENVQYQLLGSRVTPNTAKPGVGPDPDFVYGEHARVSFSIPLIGHATLATAPKFGPILKACGWQETVVDDEGDESVTYDLRADPSASDSMTLLWRDARRAHKVTGFRGRIGLSLSAGQRPMLNVTGLGLYNEVTAGAALAHADADFTGWQDTEPVANGTTAFTMAGVSGLGLREFGFEQSENVKFNDLPEQENVIIAGPRTFTGNSKLTMPAVGTFNPEAKWTAAARNAFSMVHTASAACIVAVNGGVQVLEPSYSRDDDQDVVSFGMKAVPTSRTTDDDLQIVFTWA